LIYVKNAVWVPVLHVRCCHRWYCSASCLRRTWVAHCMQLLS